MKEEKSKEPAKQSLVNERSNRMDDFVKEHVGQWEFKKRSKINEDNESDLSTEPTTSSVSTESEPTRRTSSKQRKASLDEYRELFLKAPKISDRQPVFVSRATRDNIDELVRRLGERKMSVSGFLENIARHHLETYGGEVEQWKRL